MSKEPQKHPSFRKHRNVIGKTPAHRRPKGVATLQIMPGNKSLSCLGDWYRPLDAAVFIIQTSRDSLTRKLVEYEQIPVRGYHAVINSVTGNIRIGITPESSASAKLAVDAGMPPWPGGKKRVMDATNLTLVTATFDAYKRRMRAAARRFELPTISQLTLPTILAGYKLGTVPERLDSEALRQLVCRRMERAVGTDVSDVPQKIIEDLWYNEVVVPVGGDNATGFSLIPLQYLIPADGSSPERLINRSARLFMDLKPLCGESYWNPAGSLVAEDGGYRVPNPARDALVAIDKDPDDTDLLFTDEDVTRFFDKFRELYTGSPPEALSEDMMVAALDARNAPLSIQGASLFEVYSEKKIIELMRKALVPLVSGSCTDADLLAAARWPAKELCLSGMVKTQLLSINPRLVDEPSSYQFVMDRVGYQAHVDLFTTPPEWKVSPAAEDSSCLSTSAPQVA